MKTRWSILVVLVSLLALGSFFNVRDIFTKRSLDFSPVVFMSVEEGSDIALAVERLGAPISIRQTGACENCRIFMFMGEYPDWVFGGTEAWYVVGENGKIVARVMLVEP